MLVPALAVHSLLSAYSDQPVDHPAHNIAIEKNENSTASQTNFIQSQMIISHNDARQELGVEPLLWDEKLAEDASIYAQHLAKNNIFEHDTQSGVAVRQGENLWKGTRGAFSYAEMADGWISEKSFFKMGVFPDVSVNGNWSSVGHYTQITWRSTTHFGCAIAWNTKDDVLVCRYSPAGNVIGQNPIQN